MLTSSLFAINTPGGSLAPPNETYVRGPDHVSTHPATERFPFRVQLCWTAEELGSGVLAAILTVSLQTDLLETRPGLLFEIVGQGDAIDAGSTRGWRLDAGEGPTAILVPHPTDAPETETLTREGRLGLRLSPPFLEKGVIRRCRLAAITFAGPVDESAVREAIDRFDQLPLPLTA